MQIRAEHPGEGPAIRALTDAAFAPMAYSDGSEGGIVDDLRAGELECRNQSEKESGKN